MCRDILEMMLWMLHLEGSGRGLYGVRDRMLLAR